MHICDIFTNGALEYKMQLHVIRYISITGVSQMKFKLGNPFEVKMCGTDLHRAYNFLLDERIFVRDSNEFNLMADISPFQRMRHWLDYQKKNAPHV